MKKLFSTVHKFYRGIQTKNYCQHNLRKKIDNLELNLLYRDGCKDYGSKINPRYLISDMKNRAEFLTVYPELVDGILTHPDHVEDEQFLYRLTDLTNYLVGSRLNRGVLSYIGFKELEEIFPDKKFTAEDHRRAKIYGWGVEMMETFTCILDDFLDLSSDRKGMPCWYRFKGHGILSAYDSCYIKILCYRVLEQYCKDHPGYIPVVEMFHNINFQVHMGQIATFTTDCSHYTVWLYDQIVKHKTEMFMYYQPLFVSFYAAGIFDKDLLKELDHVTRLMSRLFQIQNDVYDAFGDYESSGKIANDIQQGTCTWLIATAMSIATKVQKAVLVENYGKEDAVSVQRVKDMYEELDIKGMYRDHKQEQYDNFMGLIKTGSNKLPKKCLLLCAKHATVPYLDHVQIETEFTYD